MTLTFDQQRDMNRTTAAGFDLSPKEEAVQRIFDTVPMPRSAVIEALRCVQKVAASPSHYSGVDDDVIIRVDKTTWGTMGVMAMLVARLDDLKLLD